MYLFDYGKSVLRNFPDKTPEELFTEMLNNVIFDRNGDKAISQMFRNSFLFTLPARNNTFEEMIDKIKKLNIESSTVGNPFYYDEADNYSSYNTRTIGTQYSIPTDIDEIFLSYVGHAITLRVSDDVVIRFNNPDINKILWDGISVYKDYLLGNALRKHNELSKFLAYYLVFAVDFIIADKKITKIDLLRFLSDFEKNDNTKVDDKLITINTLNWQSLIIALCKYYYHVNPDVEKIYLNCESINYKSVKSTYGMIPVYIKKIFTLKDLYSSEYFEQKNVSKSVLKKIWDSNRLSQVIKDRQIGINSLTPILPYDILHAIDFKNKRKKENKYEKEILEYHNYLKEYMTMTLGTEFMNTIETINDILVKYVNVKDHAIESIFGAKTVVGFVNYINEFIELAKTMTAEEKLEIRKFVGMVMKNAQDFKMIQSLLKNYYLTTK